MEDWRHSFTILDVAPRWRRVINFTPRPLYPQEKSQRYPLDRRLHGPQGPCGQDKNISPAGNRSLAVQPVAIPTELSPTIVINPKSNNNIHVRILQNFAISVADREVKEIYSMSLRSGIFFEYRIYYFHKKSCQFHMLYGIYLGHNVLYSDRVLHLSILPG
jgi:hypothetical protein